MDARLAFVALGAFLSVALLALLWPWLDRRAGGRRARALSAFGLCLAAAAPYLLRDELAAWAAASPAGGRYAELERHLAQQPRDARAQIMKARLDMQAQRFELAAAAYGRALAGNSKAARDAEVWLEYAEAVGMARGGVLDAPVQALIEQALSLAPDHPKALDLAGSAALERRDYRQAARHWRRLLPQLPPGSPRHAALSAALAALEQRAP